MKTVIKGNIAKIDEMEQYSRRNCLVFHGLPEAPVTSNENTDDLIIKTVQEKLNITLSPSDIDRSHRLGQRRNSAIPRPVIIKFSRYNTLSAIFYKKKQLKGTKIMITESLTKLRAEILKSAVAYHGPNKVWTVNGDVWVNNGENKSKIQGVNVVFQ